MKKNIALLLIIITTILFVANRELNAQEVPAQDSLALVALYNSTDGVNWTNNTNWLSAQVSTWHGVTVTGGRVTALNLVGNNLNGTLPVEIGNLSELAELELGLNQISGAIPSEIGNLTNLETLDLKNNRLSSAIPQGIGNLTKLKFLYLSNNLLSGGVPDTLINLTELIGLELNNNQLVDLPNLSTIQSLRLLIISNNMFTFEDIEPNLGIGSFDYAPQDSVGTEQATAANLHSPLTVSVAVGGANNLYQWFKDGVLIPSATDSVYTVNSATAADVGSYTCEITNNIATDLTLVSRPINVTIDISIAAQDSLALVALYDSTNGDNWQRKENWLTGPVSTWQGITVAGGRVTELSLNSNNLEGTLSAAIGDLTNLQNLALQANQLSGSIPSTIGNLIKITYLDLGKNELFGTLPQEIGNMVSLIDLFLADNQISGAVPPEITNLTNLNTLDISDNLLVDLPNLSALISLSIVRIQNNRFSFEDIEPNINVAAQTFSYAPQQNVGTKTDTSFFLNSPLAISITVGGANNQYQWSKDGEVISGATDSSYIVSMAARTDSGTYVCEIKNTVATDLTLISHPIHVIVDTRVSAQDSLALVTLYNSTNGKNWTENFHWLDSPVSTPWPGVMVAGGRVTRLELPDNNLVGTIPSAIGILTEVTYIDFSNNELSGAIPTDIGNLTNLAVLVLAGNELSGTMPNEVGNLINLKAFSVAGNKNITGAIPSTIGNLVDLIGLDLSDNQLAGSIPSQIGNLVNLTDLLLSSNWLSGAVPNEIINLTKLLQLDISTNQLVDLPDLSALNSLSELYIQNNQFTFEDIEPNLGVETFDYASQDSVGTRQERFITVGQPLTISVTVGGAYNQYQWSKDGVTIQNATDSSYTLTSVALADSGEYSCKISNTIVTDLTLNSRPIHVTVDRQPSAITDPASDITQNSAVLNGRVNPSGISTRVSFVYIFGAASIQVDANQSPISGTDTVAVSAAISGLTPNGNYTYYVIATNRADTINGANQEFTTTLPPYPAQLAINSTIDFPSLPDATDYQRMAYRIIGIPGNSARPIQSFFTGGQNKDWQVYWDDGGATNYQITYDGTNTFLATTGKAFWAINKGPLSIDTTVPSAPLSTISARREILIPLHEGWNLITNPFNISIPWSTVQAMNGPTPLLDPIWSFDGSFVQANNFAPNEGYYFFNTIDLATLTIPYELYYPGTPPEPQTAAVTTWQIGIGLTSGEFNENGTTFGVSEIASAGLDALDFRKPRALKAIPGVMFQRPEWDTDFSSFASDFRPSSGETETWTFDVHAPSRAAALTFSGIASLPAQQELYLIYDLSGEFMDLRMDSVYQFTPKKELTKFRVVAGESDAVQEFLASVVPQEFELGQNYPNPFNPSTNFPVSIPEATEISFKVYNISGQEVATIFTGQIQAGRHIFNWEGKNTIGNRLSSGVYFYRLIAGKKAAMVGKMILLK